MPQITLSQVFSGGGDDFTGDAHGISDGAINLFNPIQTTGFVGRGAKNAAETNLFISFDRTGSGLELGDIINGVNFQWNVVSVVTSGDFRIGYLEQDGTWNVNGFANIDTAPPPRYFFSFLFPNNGTALPHATQDGSLTIEPNILILNAWATENLNYMGLTGIQTVGSGIGGETFLQVGMMNFLRGINNSLGLSRFAITLDSQAVPNAEIRMIITMTEDSVSANHPMFIIDYTENPPVFNGVPITEASVAEEYVYDSLPIAYSLGDQTNGIFNTPNTILTTGPAGMVVDSLTGIVTWSPTPLQATTQGVFPVSLLLTNEGGRTVTQDWVISVPAIDCVEATTSAQAAVNASSNARTAVGADSAAQAAVDASSVAQPAVDASSVVRSAVDAVAFHCPEN